MFSSNTTQVSDGGYQISRSLRFNSADSAYLNRTPASASNRKTWTWSGWVKLTKNTSQQYIFGGTQDSYNVLWTLCSFYQDKIYLQSYSGGFQFNFQTTQVFRDYSAWYHIVVAVDTTQATDTNRLKLYVNGNLVTSYVTASYPSQNADTFINGNWLQTISGSIATSYIDAYMTEVNFIDGQALTPSSFGETNAQTGVWTPIAYSGSYGTNGFYLNFSDNSNTTAATLGKDYSGNGNNWTPNNFSVTAGAGNDSLVDSPTSYGTDTGVGGEVRGNYSTMNPLDNYNTNAAVAFTFANGNLDVSRSNQSWASSRSTMAMSSGKWYAEMTVTASTAGTLNAMFGIAKQDFTINDYFGGQAGGYGYNAANGQKYNGGSGVSYGATFTTNDVIGVAYDADAGSLVFYKNGTSQGTAYTGLSGTFCFAIGLFPQTSGSITATLNCGQRPFAYTAPSGYKALCTQNLPTPTIGATTATQAGKFFNPVLYTGNGSTQAITGVGFQPDMTWIKVRSTTYDHQLVDAVRGSGKVIHSNLTNAEATLNTVTSFDSNGFTVNGTTYAGTNGNGQTFVAWNWKANGSGSTNTAGSITSTVSANTTSGFSVVTYTTTGSVVTVGHGLGVAPSMIIVKARGTTSDWFTYHVSMGATSGTYLNQTYGAIASANFWNNTAPTSNVFTNGVGVVAGGNTAVAYCFAEVAGYSKFGSYTGNGSADGPFVYTGFRPAYVLYKGSSAAGGAWDIHDAARSPRNVAVQTLFANTSGAEGGIEIDILSNGFKIRDTSANANSSGATYIFAAFAEAPLKFSLAR
jgi:hypothetical protein